jgi:hypothetical protein
MAKTSRTQCRALSRRTVVIRSHLHYSLRGDYVKVSQHQTRNLGHVWLIFLQFQADKYIDGCQESESLTITRISAAATQP